MRAPEMSEALAELHEVFGPSLLPKALRRFAFTKRSTRSDVDPLKRALPHLLELAARDDDDRDLGKTVGRLVAAHWQRWPDVERRAVRRYAEALWRHVLTVYPGVRAAGPVLDSLRTLLGDASPLLDSWRGTTTETALCQLAKLIGDTVRPGPVPADRQIVAWLAHPDLTEALWEGFFVASSHTVAHFLEDALEDLSVLHPTGEP
ncbi:hypothetical protein F0L68_21530 [Solihabitans fulvus]|uniref:Uncharacterized protein n=1 Tax=Solihabitans fulvus TaxID=1892852 RepID=A0A5B2X8R0_9PSEU|nr:hypothetical protein [Solihabitans fulvus]KAA2259511.1 hypothetical protein F0L68_21530 [Solihabitans fulvus]